MNPKRSKIADFLLTFVLCIAGFSSWAHANNDEIPFEEAMTCGQEAATENLYTLYPELLQAHQENVEQPYMAEMNLRSFGLEPQLGEEDVYMLPVIFHVLLPSGFYIDISDDEIQNSLDFLNEQYANIPTSSLAPGQGFYRPDGTNTKIQFTMALQDPSGNPTTGINRINVGFTSIPSGSPNAATNTVAWPGNDYVNIWIVPSIAGAVAGFAYLPTGPNTQDHLGGVFVEATYFNNTTLTPQGLLREYTNYNRVLAHEMGHYLGLYHTFNNKSKIPGCVRQPGQPIYVCDTQLNNNCLGHGDQVCDTPPDAWASTSGGTTCLGGVSHNSSHTDADDTSSNNPYVTDVNDIHANVMDYGGASCIQHFTQNQKERMRAVTSFARASLLVSHALQAPAVANCTYKAPVLTFSPDEVKATSLNESGIVVASIKNNNVGSECPEGTFTLTQTISDDNVDTNIVDPTINLNAQQTGTIEINYTLAMTKDASVSLQFKAVQTGQPNKKAIRGIVFQTNQINHFTNGVVKQSGTHKTASTGDVAASSSASASVSEMFSAGGGCASQNSGFAFVLVLIFGFTGLIRSQKTIC